MYWHLYSGVMCLLIQAICEEVAISLCSAGRPPWLGREGSASNLSASARLSGRSSRISTNSRRRVFSLVLLGIGGKLLARQNGPCSGTEVEIYAVFTKVL